MLWEKKTHLVKEMRSAMDVGQGESHTMKAEIHRMEVNTVRLQTDYKADLPSTF